MTRRSLLVLTVFVLTSCASVRPGDVARLPPDALPGVALGPGPARDAAIARLRSLGPRGLELMLQAPAIVAVHSADPPVLSSDTAVRYGDAVDRVAAQKDALASGLYWHVDLEEAKAEAARTSRPILSLRLLGRLDEELSCANSRFFRTVLYAMAGLPRSPNGGFTHVGRGDVLRQWVARRLSATRGR